MQRLSVQKIIAKKTRQEKICMLTCYDATFAKILDNGGCDIILVGDSLGSVIKGEGNTLNVTIEEVCYHTKAVWNGSKSAHIVADLPFMSYHCDDSQAIDNAGKLIQSGANSVKLEGGAHLANRVKAIVDLGIPVMGHIGLMPQSINAQGGYVIQGRTEESKTKLLQDALALQEAGVYAIVLEGIQSDVAELITSRLAIPTIGIGAGNHCDGQVLVLHDLLGLNPDFAPKFVKQYLNGAELAMSACRNYVNEVKSGSFPSLDHSFEPRSNKNHISHASPSILN